MRERDEGNIMRDEGRGQVNKRERDGRGGEGEAEFQLSSIIDAGI